jgi:selenocysteine lyase/cysteine desulfurase
MLTEPEIHKLRSRFPIFSCKIYLNSCSQGALSDAVEACIREYLRTGHDAGSPWDIWVQKYEAVRAEFARLIAAETDVVAIVPSASAGINSIASAFDFTARKKVVLGEFESPTMGHVWLAQQRRGAVVEFIQANGDEIAPSSYARALVLGIPVSPVGRPS